jgi:vacuolar protein sorting-associated protein 18
VNRQSGAYDALRILNDAPFELAEPLYYKHASILLARVPDAATDSFLARYSQGLSPLRLLPCIMHYEQVRFERARMMQAVESAQAHGSLRKVEEYHVLDVAVEGPKVSSDGFELRINSDVGRAASFVDNSSVSAKFLEGVIKQGCRSSAIYSYLVSLYAKLEDEELLLKFLSVHVPGTSSVNDAATKALLSGERLRAGANEDLSSPLDMSYALRTVLCTGRHFRSAIKLYMGFGMRQQAVELALKVDPSLARELAQDSVELEERRRLWLMIAKNAASDSSTRGGKDVVSRVVSVLKDCGPDVLSIEDVLPFL